MNSQRGSSRFDTVLKMLLIAFISLLAFSSGVYFGREMTENDLTLKSLESDFNDSHNHAAEKNKDFDVHEEEALAAEDVETLTDKAINKQRDDLASVATESHGEAKAHAAPGKHDAKAEHAVAKAEAKPATMPNHQGATHDSHKAETRTVASAAETKPAAKKADAHQDADAKIAAELKAAATGNKPDLTNVHEAAKRVANNETPSVAPKAPTESRVPSSLPKSVGAASETEYTVQVASYPSLPEAKTHANELVQKGFPAYPVEAKVNGKVWYRVSVGSFKSMKEAGTFRTQLMKQANLSSAIVQKIAR